jgi:hypothetical protein
MLNEITLYWLTNSAASSAKFYFEQQALGLNPNLGRVAAIDEGFNSGTA